MTMNTAMVPTCTGQGLADGHKARLVEFERFELKFKQCLSSSAISTKFEQHHTRGTEIVAELQQLLESEELFVQEKRSFYDNGQFNTNITALPLTHKGEVQEL